MKKIFIVTTFNKPLNFTAVSSSSISLNKSADDESLNATIKYSYDNCSWEDYIWTGTSGMQISLLPGEKVYFKGNNEAFSRSSSNYYKFAMTGKIEAHGNIMSLVDESMLRKDIPNAYCFFALFDGCTSLLTAPELPATQLQEATYIQCFNGCTSLNEAPELPADQLAVNCYNRMFDGCTSLRTAGRILATELTDKACVRTFRNCSNLIEPPEMFFTTTAPSGCLEMFRECSSLTYAPNLPAKIVADNAYSNMFYGCTTIKHAPEIGAETVLSSGMNGLFSHCTSLVTGANLSAKTLGVQCYRDFYNTCTSLVTAPDLPALDIPASAYYCMLSGCTSLVNVPEELPAPTIGNYSYANMFTGCSSITKAPVIKATTFGNQSLNNMFNNCSSLNEIEVEFTSWPASATTSWVSGVAAAGTFKCPADLPETKGNNNIPTGWTIQKPAPPPFDLLVSYKLKDEDEELCPDEWLLGMEVGTVINGRPFDGFRCINSPHTVDAQDAANEAFIFEYEEV